MRPAVCYQGASSHRECQSNGHVCCRLPTSPSQSRRRTPRQCWMCWSFTTPRRSPTARSTWASQVHGDGIMWLLFQTLRGQGMWGFLHLINKWSLFSRKMWMRFSGCSSTLLPLKCSSVNLDAQHSCKRGGQSTGWASQTHTFSDAHSQHLEGRSQTAGAGLPLMKVPGENRQLNFAPVSVCRVGVDVAFRVLGVSVSLLPCAMVEEWAWAAWVLENCWLGSSKSRSCQGFVPLSMGYLPSEGHLQPPLLFLSTATPSFSKY